MVSFSYGQGYPTLYDVWRKKQFRVNPGRTLEEVGEIYPPTSSYSLLFVNPAAKRQLVPQHQGQIDASRPDGDLVGC